MVCYCSRRRILFIHIPKTGGLTVEKILCDFYGFKKFTFRNGSYDFLNDPAGKRGIFKYILSHSEEAKKYDLKNFYKFAFVRNPLTRAVSAINYLSDRSHKNDGRFPRDYQTFVRRSRADVYFYMHFNLNQVDCLKDDNNEINFQFIGRFENLMNDLNKVLIDILGLRKFDFDSIHVNKSSHKMLFSEENLREDILRIHEKDFIFIENLNSV